MLTFQSFKYLRFLKVTFLYQIILMTLFFFSFYL